MAQVFRVCTGAGVTGGYKVPSMGAETEFRFSVRAESEFSGLPRYLYLQAHACVHTLTCFLNTRKQGWGNNSPNLAPVIPVLLR